MNPVPGKNTVTQEDPQQVTHTRAARIEIDEAALRHNLQRVKSLAPESQIMAVIKANAYGHGVFAAADSLSEADAFALAMPGEAIKLRLAGISKPLVVLQGFANADVLSELAELDIQPTIIHEDQISLLEQHNGAPLSVWLKIDTGMHRLGISVESAESAYRQLSACASVKEIRIMSHFANADDPSNSYNNRQLKLLINVNNTIGAEASMANSAGLIAIPESRLHWVRPGIMLYGSSPLLNQTADDLQLRAVMNFESSLVSVQQLKQGDVIGYGSTWECPEDMMVGVVAAGYADGYPRHAESGTPVWINQQRCPLVGRVSMDSICVDLRGVEAKSGDRVVLWGNELSVDEVAQHAGTIGYELLCSAGNAAK
jgi:alanine racemase